MALRSRGSKADLLGSSLRLKETKQSERAYLDAMGLLTNQTDASAREELTVDMRSFNEHTLSGKYHVFRINNKFPIPGGAVADDFYRRKLIEQNASRAKALREEAGFRATEQEIAGKAFDKQQQTALPSSIERLVVEADKAIEEHDHQKQYAAENLQGHAGSPADIRRVFALIRNRKVTELEQLFATGEINTNMVEPALYYSGLILSSSYGLLTTVRQYLRHGANPNLRTSSGYTALHTAWDSWLKVNPHIPKKAFQRNATFAIVEELLRYKADPNLKTSNGTTALHMACQYGHEQLVIQMLKHGADPAIRDNAGRTAELVASEQCEKGNIDRRGCIGIIRNWHILRAQHASHEFNAAWKLTMESASSYATAMAKQSRQGGGSTLPQAGVVDVTARGGADAPLIAASQHARKAFWGETENVEKMLHAFSVQQQIFDHRPAKDVEIVKFDAKVPSLPSLLDVRSRTTQKTVPAVDNSRAPSGIDSYSNAAHKKHLKAQWEHANVPQAAAEDAAARQAMYNQATQLATERRCTRLDKIAPNESQLLEDTISVANQRDVAKLQRMHLQAAAKTKASSVLSGSTEEQSVAEKAVIALKQRLKSAAYSIVNDAKVSVEITAPTGERFVQRPAIESALLRPSRFRVDNRQGMRNRGSTPKGSVQATVDEIDMASVSGIPSPSLALDLLALETRRQALDTRSAATGADKAELDANLACSQTFIDDARLLPAKGSYSQQIQQKLDELKAAAITNQFAGRSPPPGYEPRKKAHKKHTARKLDELGNNLHYGNPLELHTAADKPPAHGVLHAAGAINTGSSASMMSLSTLDTSTATYKVVVSDISRSLGVAVRALPAQYGIRKAVEHEGGSEPSFAESQQLQARKKKRERNLYSEVESSKKQWHKSSSLFGRPEEPWTNGGVSAPSERLPLHSSRRPPKGFKRIRNGHVVYL